eukprot:COSAG05_NODE_2295_length_3264_cov_2.986730_2_plen_58_part_00
MNVSALLSDASPPKFGPAMVTPREPVAPPNTPRRPTSSSPNRKRSREQDSNEAANER